MLQTGHRLLRSAYGGRTNSCSQAVVSPCPQSYKPSIIFQHPELLAINKPPGLPFHSRDGVVGVIPTLRHMEAANEIPQLGPLYPLHRCSCRPVRRLIGVRCCKTPRFWQLACLYSSATTNVLKDGHEVPSVLYCRLDEVTSGILLLGKTRPAAQRISIAFAESRVHKCYVALSDRKPNKKQGTITGDMAKARRGSWKLLRTTHDPAVTKFTSVAVVGDRRPGLRMYIARPLTGKTHQIRVAMKSNGVPILGDVRYADKAASEKEDRTYLHAAAISFDLDGQFLQIVCPPTVGSEFLTQPFQSVWQQHSPGFL